MTQLRTLWRIHADRAGQATVEWTLILVFLVLPMLYVFRMLLEILADHYTMVAFMETLPLP